MSQTHRQLAPRAKLRISSAERERPTVAGTKAELENCPEERRSSYHMDPENNISAAAR